MPNRVTEQPGVNTLTVGRWRARFIATIVCRDNAAANISGPPVHETHAVARSGRRRRFAQALALARRASASGSTISTLLSCTPIQHDFDHLPHHGMATGNLSGLPDQSSRSPNRIAPHRSSSRHAASMPPGRSRPRRRWAPHRRGPPPVACYKLSSRSARSRTTPPTAPGPAHNVHPLSVCACRPSTCPKDVIVFCVAGPRALALSLSPPRGG